MRIAVLEPGAWGTALGIILNKKNEVSFWYQNPELVLNFNKFRKNDRLPDIKIPQEIFISSGLKKIVEKADLIIIASPSFNFRKTLSELKIVIGNTRDNLPPLLGIAKGIEKETLKVPSQIVEEFFPKISYAHLSGPGFAKEIIRGIKAEEVIASKNKFLLKDLRKVFQNSSLKVSTTSDLVGVQLAGALKNVLSIGISLVEAKGDKDTSIEKKLIDFGLNEMAKVGKVMGAKKNTFWGPAGLGDLVLTSTNPLSRNFQFGKHLISDTQKLRKDITERKLTVEGFESAFACYQLEKNHKLDLPMINEIYKVIYENNSPEETIENLIKLV